MLSPAQFEFVTTARVGRLATADSGGQPHVIPIVFTMNADKLYTPLDKKPKTVGPNQLKRVRNVAANPQIAVVIDHYEEDWTRLAWVLISGTAEIVTEGELHTRGVHLLTQKYKQYETMRLEGRPIIVITIARVKSWGI